MYVVRYSCVVCLFMWGYCSWEKRGSGSNVCPLLILSLLFLSEPTYGLCYAFVEFTEVSSANTALLLTNTPLFDKTLSVQLASGEGVPELPQILPESK